MMALENGGDKKHWLCIKYWLSSYEQNKGKGNLERGGLWPYRLPTCLEDPMLGLILLLYL